MSTDLLVSADREGRVLLGSLAEHEYYIVSAEKGGVIRLTPAVLVKATAPSGGYEPPVEGPRG